MSYELSVSERNMIQYFVSASRSWLYRCNKDGGKHEVNHGGYGRFPGGRIVHSIAPPSILTYPSRLHGTTCAILLVVCLQVNSIEIDGSELDGCEYHHPIDERLKCKGTLEDVISCLLLLILSFPPSILCMLLRPVLLSSHVATSTGTGLVHTAPGHGLEDYRVGMHHAIQPYSPVGTSGNLERVACKTHGPAVTRLMKADGSRRTSARKWKENSS